MPYIMLPPPGNLSIPTDWCENDQWKKDYMFGPPGIIPPYDSPLIVYACRIVPYLNAPPPGWGATATLMINAAVRRVIDSFEPGLHDFVPVELRYVDFQPYQNEDLRSFIVYPYFIARIDQICHAVDQEKSDIKIYRPGVWMKKPGKPLILKREVIRDKHLWRENTHLFCSDQLHDSLIDSRLDSGWTFDKQEVV